MVILIRCAAHHAPTAGTRQTTICHFGITRTANELSKYLLKSDRDPDAGKVNGLLQKQNAELLGTVGSLDELVKLQGKVTDGTVYTRGSVEAAARKLIRGVNAKGDVRQRGLAELRRVFLLP